MRSRLPAFVQQRALKFIRVPDSCYSRRLKIDSFTDVRKLLIDVEYRQKPKQGVTLLPGMYEL